MSERSTPSSLSRTFGAPAFSTPSEIFKRYASPTLITPSKGSTIENSLYINNNTLRLESPTKSPSITRYQTRFESPSERDDGLKSPSSPRETSSFSNDKNVKENFVLLDQDDFSQGIEVIRTKIDSIEDEMKSMQAQYSRFQEKVSGSIVNLQKNLDSFLTSIEFSTGNDKIKWKGKKRDEFLQSLESSIKNEKLEDIYHLLTVYRTGLKQNIFDFKDQSLRNAVENATKLFQEKLNLIQSLDCLEKEISSFLDEMYNNIESSILEVLNFGDEKLRLKVEYFDKTFTKNLRLFSLQFGKETSLKVNKTQKFVDESFKIIEMIKSFVSSLEKNNSQDLEFFYSKVPTDMVRLLKQTHYCLSSFSCSLEKQKDLLTALQIKDVNQVKIAYNSFTSEIEKIVASNTLKEGLAFLSQNCSERMTDEKEKRKKEVVQRIKNIIEKSDTFSVEKQQKFTQILLESGIRDPLVLKELRMAWETKRSKIFDDKFNKEQLLQTYLEKLQSAISTKDVPLLEAAVIVPDGIKSDSEKWHNLRDEAKRLLDSLLSVSVEELDIKFKLETMLKTKDLSNFQIVKNEIRNDFKDKEISEIWNRVCELKQKQEEIQGLLNLSLGSKEFYEELNSVSANFNEKFVNNQWKLWERHNIHKMEIMVEEAILEKEESKVKSCLEIIEAEDRLKPLFVSSINQLKDILDSIQESRVLLETALVTRKKINLEMAISKSKRFSSSLSNLLSSATSMLSQLNREEELLEEYNSALRQKNLAKIRNIINLIENATDDCKNFQLLKKAKTAEVEIQEFIKLESRLMEKDFTDITALFQYCKNCTEFCDNRLLDEVEYIINQNQIVKNKVLDQFEYIHTNKGLEEFLLKFDNFLSKSDFEEITNLWKNNIEKRLVDEFNIILELGNECLLHLWSQKARDISFQEENTSLALLQKKSQDILESINIIRKSMQDSIISKNIGKIEEDILSIEGNFMEKEKIFLTEKLKKLKARNDLLNYAETTLDSSDINISSIDSILSQLYDHDQDEQILFTIDKVIQRKQSIIAENNLYNQISHQIEQKNPYEKLELLIDEVKKIPSLSKICTEAEEFLVIQFKMRDELKQIVGKQLNYKKFEDLDFQKFYDYLPTEEVNNHIEHLKYLIFKLNESQKMFEDFSKSNEQIMVDQIASLEFKISDIKLEQAKSLELEKNRIDEELKIELEKEKARIQFDIEKTKKAYAHDIEKIKEEEVETKKNVLDQFLKSKETLLQNAEQDQILLQQKSEELEKLLATSLQYNFEITQIIEKLNDDIHEKENQNKEMELYIKSLEENFKNLVELEPNLANEERKLSESISQIEDKIELHKENICLFREKLEEQDLILKDKILYQNMAEEKYKKIQEEIDIKVEEVKVKYDTYTKELSLKEEQTKETERRISEIEKLITIEEESHNGLCSNLDLKLPRLDELCNKRRSVELELERTTDRINETERHIQSLEITQKEELEILNMKIAEKTSKEHQLKSDLEAAEINIQSLSSRIQNSLLTLDEKRCDYDKFVIDAENIEKKLKEEEAKHKMLLENADSVRCKIKEFELCINSEELHLEVLKEQVIELETKVKDTVQKKVRKEEVEKQLKDQLMRLEEEIILLDNHNSEKTDIIEKLKDDSKLKTLEKLEMLQKLEQEEEKVLTESIVTAEESLKILKERCNSGRDMEQKLENEKQALQNYEIECMDKIKGLECAIFQLESEIKNKEILFSNKQQEFNDIRTTSINLQDSIIQSNLKVEEDTNLVEKLGQDILENSSKLLILEEQKNSLQTRLSVFKENLEKETQGVETLISINKELESKLTETISRKERLQQEFEDFSERKNALNQIIADIEAQFLDQQTTFTKSIEEKENLEKKIKELCEELTTAQAIIFKLEKEKLEREQTISSIEQENRNLEILLLELTNNENDLISNKNSQESHIEEKKVTIKKLEDTIIELEEKVFDLASQETKLRETILEKENKIKSSEKSITELHQKAVELDNQNTNSLAAQQQYQESSIIEKENNIEKLEQLTRALETNLSELVKQELKLEESILEKKNSINISETSILEKESNIKRLDVLIVCSEKKLSELSTQESQLDGTIEEKDSQVMMLEKLISEKGNRINILEASIEGLNRKLNDISNQKARCEETVFELENILKISEKEKLEREQTISSIEQENRNFEILLLELTNNENDLISNKNSQESHIEEKKVTIKKLEDTIIELEEKVFDLASQETKLRETILEKENKIKSSEKSITKLHQKVVELDNITSFNKPILESEQNLSHPSINDNEPESSKSISKEVEIENVIVDDKKDEEKQIDESKEKKKGVLPSKSNKTQASPPIEAIDNALSALYKKAAKAELKVDEENKVILNYFDPHVIEVSRQYSLILSDQCNIGHNTPTFLYNIIIPKFVDYIMNSIKKESEVTTQNKLKKLVKKFRGFKKSFSDLELSKKIDKEYFTLSLLYVYYLNVNSFFSKDFWDTFLTSTEFLKEFFAPSSILYQPNTKEDLIFLSKKQSKFKIKNINLFETSEEVQNSISDNLLSDFPNTPPIESLKSILAEIKCKIDNTEIMEKIVTRKLSRSLLSILEVGFRAFKFFGRYFFWDFIKFYIDKAEKTQGEIKDVYNNINELVACAKIKFTEPNDVKFVMLVTNAFNKRKLAEWFKKLFSLQQIGDYFTEESIIRSDKMNEIILLLENIEIYSKSYMVEFECTEDLSFNYEKCVWNQ